MAIYSYSGGTGWFHMEKGEFENVRCSLNEDKTKKLKCTIMTA